MHSSSRGIHFLPENTRLKHKRREASNSVPSSAPNNQVCKAQQHILPPLAPTLKHQKPKPETYKKIPTTNYHSSTYYSRHLTSSSIWNNLHPQAAVSCAWNKLFYYICLPSPRVSPRQTRHKNTRTQVRTALVVPNLPW